MRSKNTAREQGKTSDRATAVAKDKNGDGGHKWRHPTPTVGCTSKPQRTSADERAGINTAKQKKLGWGVEASNGSHQRETN